MRNCLTDQGRPLGTGLQGQVPTHLRRLWSKAMVVSTEGKGLARTKSGDRQEEDRKGTAEPILRVSIPCGVIQRAGRAGEVKHVVHRSAIEGFVDQDFLYPLSRGAIIRIPADLRTTRCVMLQERAVQQTEPGLQSRCMSWPILAVAASSAPSRVPHGSMYCRNCDRERPWDPRYA